MGRLQDVMLHIRWLPGLHQLLGVIRLLPPVAVQQAQLRVELHHLKRILQGTLRSFVDRISVFDDAPDVVQYYI